MPKKPRIKEKEPLQDQRKVIVAPIAALTDKRLSDNVFRVLALICSYCNRAGITWVSQKKLAADAKVSQQAISKQLVKLVAVGYIEIVRKARPGERTTTYRVIFDPSLKVEDAISITSSVEDTRPPYMVREQADLEGQRRIANLISNALKSTKPKEYSMPVNGETRAVKSVKEAMLKAKKRDSKRDSHTTSGVVPEDVNKVVSKSIHAQPGGHIFTTLEVVQNTENTPKVNLYIHKVLHNQDLKKMISVGLSEKKIEELIGRLMPLYAAEGLQPSSSVLTEGVLQLSRDAA